MRYVILFYSLFVFSSTVGFYPRMKSRASFLTRPFPGDCKQRGWWENDVHHMTLTITAVSFDHIILIWKMQKWLLTLDDKPYCLFVCFCIYSAGEGTPSVEVLGLNVGGVVIHTITLCTFYEKNIYMFLLVVLPPTLLPAHLHFVTMKGSFLYLSICKAWHNLRVCLSSWLYSDAFASAYLSGSIAVLSSSSCRNSSLFSLSIAMPSLWETCAISSRIGCLTRSGSVHISMKCSNVSFSFLHSIHVGLTWFWLKDALFTCNTYDPVTILALVWILGHPSPLGPPL